MVKKISETMNCYFVPSFIIILILSANSLLISETSERQNVSGNNYSQTFPNCSIELEQIPSNVVSSYHLKFTGSAGNHILCEPLTTAKNNLTSLQCDNDSNQISFPSGRRVNGIFFHNIFRLNCTDTDPLQYRQAQVLPFAGIVTDFSKDYNQTDNNVEHKISIGFPKIFQENEGLDAYNGNYSLYRENRTWEINFQLMASPINPTGIANDKPSMCIKIFDNTMHCKVAHSDSELYFVNVGGLNPLETTLLEPCLNHGNVNQTCGNKYLGSNCLQQRFCKKITPIHPYGLVRCQSDKITKNLEYFTDINIEIHTNMSKMWEEELLIIVEEKGERNRKNITPSLEDDRNANSSENNTNEEELCSVPPVVRTTALGNLLWYDRDYYELECHFIDYFLVKPVVWFVQYTNQSEHVVFVDNGENLRDMTRFTENRAKHKVVELSVQIQFSHYRFQAKEGMESVGCEMWYWNSTRKARNIRKIEIKSSQAPNFHGKFESISLELGENRELSCEEHNAQPPPRPDQYKWVVKLHNGQVRSNKGPKLEIINAGLHHSGEYVCNVSNFLGSSNKTFIVTTQSHKGEWLNYGVMLMVLILVLGLALGAGKMYNAYWKRKMSLSEAEIQELMLGNLADFEDNEYAHFNARYMAYDQNYEVSLEKFELSEKEIGNGIHGVVYEGKMGQLPVAIKTVRKGVDKEVLKAVVDEIKIMIHLGSHDYIVDFQGACTKFLKQGRVYVLLEFCQFGSLQDFLQKNRSAFYSPTHPTYVNSEVGRSHGSLKPFTVRNLIQWSIQIAKGMSYLESKKVIHGDLAIRNVLMRSIDHVKITDFGLSRQLVDTNTYVKARQGLIPWRYMAIESLKFHIFTSKSDVWSYGVTVWEIFTLGTTPYPGMNWNLDFLVHLEDDMRLYKPKHANDAVYKILTACWAPEPERRPSFPELVILMATLNGLCTLPYRNSHYPVYA